MNQEKPDKYHYHEIVDRCHLLCSMIDDHLIDHPGMTEEMNINAQNAQMFLCDIMSNASNEIDKLEE